MRLRVWVPYEWMNNGQSVTNSEGQAFLSRLEEASKSIVKEYETVVVNVENSGYIRGGGEYTCRDIELRMRQRRHPGPGYAISLRGSVTTHACSHVWCSFLKLLYSEADMAIDALTTGKSHLIYPKVMYSSGFVIDPSTGNIVPRHFLMKCTCDKRKFLVRKMETNQKHIENTP